MPIPEKPWYLVLFESFLLEDIPLLLGLPPSDFARDVETISTRISHEGESFLTKTLPALGKEFDQMLAGARFQTRIFKKIHRQSRPAFLQALTKRIFDNDGCIFADPCLTSIACFRQVCMWAKKVEKGYNEEVLSRAVNDFVSVDQALPHLDLHRDLELLVRARSLIERVFKVNITCDSLRPKHGPGSVAWAGSRRWEKYALTKSYTELEKVFRPIPWFFSLRDAAEDFSRITDRMSTPYGCSRLSSVEKDSSGPRLIGLEPAEYMWCQQALKSFMYQHIESHPLTRGRVNFTDQTVNQRMTSHWAYYDTLDMSSASDRNSFELVEYLFNRTSIWPYLKASRTPGVVLPDGTYLAYKKFAPMGSAVCFPVEAMVFWALAVSTLIKEGMTPLSAVKRVYVYGDDLIVPTGYFSSLQSSFESVGLKFSQGKCFTTGKFRESCGRDAYDGCNVTPLRLRHPYVTSLPDAVSLIAHANELYNAGYAAASRRLRESLRSGVAKHRKFFRSIPVFNHPSSILHFECDEPPTAKVKFRNGVRSVYGLVISPVMEGSVKRVERSMLRVSLSTGGCIGTFSNGTGSRRLAKRFAVSLRKRWVTY